MTQTPENMLNIRHHQGNENQNQNDVYIDIIVKRLLSTKTRNNKYWWGCGENGTLIHY